ncbi:hypothetical protein SAICODRAFT_54438 [Saitoella complicata NRRL Y-17804]|uniref:Large ribosomal subunit protein mL60 n=1 Tax=Saitoella complicata (strain BCRC 22490 / CBS 7301 / JCM 7358 / NBRC 10748 / NRRL Y-17804) TaxID=698492 RepID=A0A0E9N7I3_SAICN|nr:uncharacterized protein SAICODRAFT_54438 [Saitoella complicata NRRL Y-17804]ODQ54306.1 hypothetical protein SAICODRAFT_54438 [Saitoella complicata NRRL Y-17804]GAO45768.1 hypothetical protein G7K_0020-t1 [Saitoella complicata NRRL Y-17804]
MFGAFRPSQPVFGGLLWKIPYRLSSPRKFRQRKRLQAVDAVINTLSKALASTNETCHALEKVKKELIPESEMLPRDKYWVFSKKHENFTKGVHKVPKWTRISHPRERPYGF